MRDENKLGQTAAQEDEWVLDKVVPNATVEILRNTQTGEYSVGWWENDKGVKTNGKGK